MHLSRALVLILGLILSGCSTGNPLPDQPGLAIALERYYARHAIEGDGRCTLPEMNVQDATILEQDADRMTVEASYHWVDRRRGSGVAKDCMGFGTRTFTLIRGQIMMMSGGRR